jgi:serine-type D-Ala-D-Ala carboxypeptidase (penicillin-binding protein 5/6)
MKIKKICFNILLALLLLAVLAPSILAAPVKTPGDPKNKVETNLNLGVDAKSAILMEPVTGKIIFEKSSHEKLAPASVTKIMTMLIAMENIDSGKIKMSDKVTVSENAKKMGGSSMILDTGEVRTVEELLKGIAIASGNDAAVAMAEYIGGSENNFVALMNERAAQLGMNDSTFKNCTGLSSPGHVTSAYDITLMSRELLKHSNILKYTGTYMETITEGRRTPIGLVNHNKLVRFFKGCDGIKTGFTDEAKYCISATAMQNNVRMLCVIMGSPTYKVRNKDASALMNYGFSKFENVPIVKKDEVLQKIDLNKQGDRYFKVKASKDFNLLIEKGSKNTITKKYTIDTKKREYKANEVVGYCEIYVNDQLNGKINIYSDRDVKKLGIFDNFKFNLMKIFDTGV